MKVPPQPPLGEEPEKETELQSARKTPDQPTPTSETVSHEEATEQPVEASEAISHEEATEQPAVHASDDEETPHPVAFSESPAAAEESTEETIVADEAAEDEDGDLEEDSAATRPEHAGVFIKKSVLIGAISAVVLIALLGALLFYINRPQDPPTDWISSFTPPAGSGSANKIMYYLHWTNENGELKGQLQLAAYANGAPQSLTAPASGLYDRDNHTIYVVITINGQPGTLMGKINDSNDTLTLNQVGAQNQTTQLVFHTGSSDEYKQATKTLAPAKK